MKCQPEMNITRVSGTWPALLMGCALTAWTVQAPAASVQAPPLPPGSALVKLQGGLNEKETKRHERAHHHKLHIKKDYTRDDTLDDDKRDKDDKAAPNNKSNN